jgi:hypothetical protein
MPDLTESDTLHSFVAFSLSRADRPSDPDDNGATVRCIVFERLRACTHNEVRECDNGFPSGFVLLVKYGDIPTFVTYFADVFAKKLIVLIMNIGAQAIGTNVNHLRTFRFGDFEIFLTSFHASGSGF